MVTQEPYEWLSKGQMTVPNLLLDCYHVLNISSDEMLLYLHLWRLNQKGIVFPDTNQLARYTNHSTNEIYQTIQRLIDKQMIAIKTTQDCDGKQSDYFDLTGALELVDNYRRSQSLKQRSNSGKEVVAQIEQEFNHPLSPMELELVKDWLNKYHYSAEMLQKALRETILNNATSLRYMDKILLSWDRLGLKEGYQIERYLSQHNTQSASTNARSSNIANVAYPDIPLDNWLDQGE